MKTKRKYEVDLLVALFITKEIEAEDEDEAQRIAEESLLNYFSLLIFTFILNFNNNFNFSYNKETSHI